MSGRLKLLVYVVVYIYSVLGSPFNLFKEVGSYGFREAINLLKKISIQLFSAKFLFSGF
jgi:hypothetical protein